MSRQRNLTRRSFIKFCASAIAAVGASPRVLARTNGVLHHYHRVKLVDARDRAIRPADLNLGENYLFHYPYAATPCFLLNLGKPVFDKGVLETQEGRRYRWEGGVGPNRSIVAFSAICSHRLSYPARQVSFINYRDKPVTFVDKDNQTVRRSQVIYCCSEKSVYDPARGAKVLGGPAPQPLAAILLEYDPEEDALYAAGAYGGEMFEKFFEQFSFRLGLEMLTDDVRRQATHTATVLPLAQFSETQVLC